MPLLDYEDEVAQPQPVQERRERTPTHRVSRRWPVKRLGFLAVIGVIGAVLWIMSRA